MGDRHTAAEIVGADLECRDVQEVLSVSRVYVEILDPVGAESWQEGKAIAASTPDHCVRTATAANSVIPLIAAQHVSEVRTNDILHSADQAALRISAQARDWLQRDAQVDSHAFRRTAEADGVVAVS